MGRADPRLGTVGGMASRAPAPRPSSLADDLRARSDTQLAALLLARPDLARPAPTDLTTLAARASTAPSVTRALDGLDRGRLHALEALHVADGDVATAAALCVASQTEMRRAAEALRELALVWKQGAAYRVPTAVAGLLGPWPGGLAPAEDDDAPLTPEVIRERLEHLGPPARKLLDNLTWGPPVGELPADGSGRLDDAVREATELGLVRRASDSRVRLPRPVALVLRDGRIARGTPLAAPAPPWRTRPARSDDAALAAVTDLLDRVAELGHLLGTAPPKMLRTGALGVRELRRLAAEADLDRELAVVLLEIANAAGLIGTVETGGGRRESDDTLYAPTLAFDTWRHLPASSRWAWLVLAWFGTDRAPAAIINADVADLLPRGSVPALFGADATSGTLRTVRLELLAHLAELPPDVSSSLPDLVAALQWRRPRRKTDHVREGARVARDEATLLGVMTGGALTDAGRALWGAWSAGTEVADLLENPALTEHPQAAAALTRLGDALPPAADRVLLQADLTAVVPGRLEGHTADLLRLAADLESRGGAAVFRFSADSVRRYLDDGATADSLLTALAERSPGGIPQPLDYLVRDVARRHGRVRVGETATFLSSDDTATLDAIAHDPRLAGLGLRRLAPTVMTTRADRRDVVDALRTAGHSPLVEGRSGTMAAGRLGGTRAVDDRRRKHPTPVPPTIEDAAHTVRAMRAGDEAAGAARTRSGPGIAATDPSVTLGVLREAAVSRSAVWIGLAGSDGSTSRLLFHPTEIAAGRAVGVVDGSGEPRTFSVHRLIGAIPVS